MANFYNGHFPAPGAALLLGSLLSPDPKPSAAGGTGLDALGVQRAGPCGGRYGFTVKVKVGVGKRVGPVRVGVSNRGLGAGAGPFSTGVSTRGSAGASDELGTGMALVLFI